MSNATLISPTTRTNSWISCFCIVTFDLEIGQAIENVYPPTVTLSEQEKINISYLAFPDSNVGLIGDIQYHFRIPSNGTLRGGEDATFCPYSNSVPLVYKQEKHHYYGFVYFRQIKDASIRRGYFQKSVLIITRLPFFNFFTTLLERIAPEVFKVGIDVLEVLFQEMSHWSDPRPGSWLQLPVMGQIIAVRIPAKGQKKELPPHFQVPATITALSSVSDLNLSCVLQSVFSQAHLLWELVLTNEAIFVMGTSPKLCADFVQSLVSLIQPLKYAEDYRPYFTVHDVSFKHYIDKKIVPHGIILGVTNPYFAKVLEHWPVQIRIGDSRFIEGKVTSSIANSSSANSQEPRSGVFTHYKSFIQRDKNFLKLIEKPPTFQGKRPVEAQNLIIRKYFEDLTANFLIPLERYLVTLMPMNKDIIPWITQPKIKKFNCEEFIRTLTVNGPQHIVGTKGNWEGLYRSFLNSANFRAWFEEREAEANLSLRKIHLDKFSKIDINFWVRGKQEVEIMDFFLRLRSILIEAQTLFPSPGNSVVVGLKRCIANLIHQMPTDLKEIVTAC